MKNFREENKKVIEDLLETIGVSTHAQNSINVNDKGSTIIANYLVDNGVSIIKRGIWQRSTFEGVSRCSCCELPTRTPNKIDQYFSFCPNCGAEMIGKDWGWE